MKDKRTCTIIYESMCNQIKTSRLTEEEVTRVIRLRKQLLTNYGIKTR